MDIASECRLEGHVGGQSDLLGLFRGGLQAGFVPGCHLQCRGSERHPEVVGILQREPRDLGADARHGNERGKFVLPAGVGERAVGVDPRTRAECAETDHRRSAPVHHRPTVGQRP
ncbi:MAG: hypothetical protein J4F45_00205 [Pseudomonadales bacterium]|nr:hypothetical protein [Pseudomonadales bacterium]